MSEKNAKVTSKPNFIKFGFFGVFLCLFGGLLYLISPNLISRRYKQELQLKNGSQMYANWMSNDTKTVLKVYFFEIMNSRDVVNGKQAIVQEVGPYQFNVYREKRINIYSENEDILEYEEFKSYHFNEFMSVGSLRDKISVINVPIVALSASLTNFVNRFPLSIVTRPILSAVLQGILQIHQQYFVIRRNVRELMFSGYRLNVFDTITALSAPLRLIGFRIPIPKLVNNSFALYYGRNASIEGPFEVYAGISDATKLAQVRAWRGLTKLKYWSHDSCNAINGTYGNQFSPFVKKTDKLFVFLPELCRSAELMFQNESEVNGVKTFRFALSNDVYKSSNANEDNWCFCRNNKTTKICENDGVIDVSNCKSGAPILMSNPHYLYASPELQNSVLGLNSDVEKHSTYFDIEPISGTVLRSRKRFGINVYVQRFPTLNVLRRSLKNTILPLAWIEEESEVNERETVELQNLFQPVQVADVAINTLLYSGVSLIVLTLFLQCCRRKSNENEVKIIEQKRNKGCCCGLFRKSTREKDNNENDEAKILETKIRPVMSEILTEKDHKYNGGNNAEIDDFWDDFSTDSRDFDRHSTITTMTNKIQNVNAVPPIETTNDDTSNNVKNKTVMNGDVRTGSLAVSKKILGDNKNQLKRQFSNESIIERRSLNGIDYRGISVLEAIEILNEKFGNKQ